MKKYIKPEIEMVSLETEDVITASDIELPEADITSDSLTINYQEQSSWSIFD